MKKIFIMAYLRNNLGDDLFVKELINRYPNEKFYIDVIDLKYGEVFRNSKNVEVRIEKEENFNKIEINQYDAFIYIGGSIFMEGGKVYNLDENCVNFIKNCKEKNKPFFYISSNYGPYKTNKYFELSKQAFSSCTDICFRDEYSYNLFKDIGSVRYEPDLLFSYKIDNIEKEKNSVGISVIDLEIREKLKHKEEEYVKFLVGNIEKFLQEGKNIYLFSFCKEEDDEKAIEKVLENIKNKEERNKIKVIKYNNNLREFLNIYKKMEYMVCQRFHSLILSCVCNQKIFVVSYSKKIDNVIEELKLGVNYIKHKNLKEDEKLNFIEFREAKNIEKIKTEAEKQFKELDKFIWGE